MSDEVLAIGDWASNSAMIADVARLSPRDDGGYLSGSVLDATYGLGGFWKSYRPTGLVASDRELLAGVALRASYLALPFRAGAFDTVVVDPPYRLSGRRDQGEKDVRYGTTVRQNRESVLDELCAAAVECYRIARRYLLVKCQDQVEGGRVRWQTRLIADAVEAAGGRQVGQFIFETHLRPQPAGRVQRTERRNYSTLLAFERQRRSP